MLFALAFFVISKDCPIGEIPKSAEQVAKMGQPSRMVLKTFGFNVSTEVPEFDSLSTIPLPYLYSVVGFGIPLLIVFVFLFIWFLLHQLCCWCCCCVATRSKKPGCFAIIVHLIAVCACAAATCMFFFAASAFSRAVIGVKDLPSSTKTEFDGVFDTVDNVIDDMFTLVHGVMDATTSNLTSFVDWILTENTKCQKYCGEIDQDMKDYKDALTTVGSDFDTPYKAVATALTASCNGDQAQSYRESWAAMSVSIDAGVKAVGEVTKQLTDATDSIQKNAKNIKETIDGSLKDVNAKISEYENGGLRDTITGFRQQIDSLVDTTKPVEQAIGQYGNYINWAVYIGTCFLGLVTVVYAIFFFCNNCCSRCLACSFPACGLLLTVLIILPGAVFAAMFYLFYDVCPVLESKAGKLLKDYMPPESVEEVLLCPVAKPLLDSINLGFDYREVIETLSKEAKSALDAFEIPKEMKEDLENFAQGFTVQDQMNSQTLVYKNAETLPKTKEYLKSDECNKPGSEIPDSSFTQMRNAIDKEDVKLNSAREKMENIIKFGGSIVGESETRRVQVVGLVDGFIGDATKIVETGIDSITCETSRCVYAPVKNAICVNFLNGVSFWIFSSVLMIAGVLIMDINYCCRRRNMKGTRTGGTSESYTETSTSDSYSESSSSSLDDFHPRRGKRYHRH